MICNRTETGWEVVYQQAHALLAAQLVAYWRAAERPERWTATLSAVAQHDNGWQEWEPGERLTPVGTPRDFTETPAKDLVAQSERALLRAWHGSLWEGLLVSRHLSRLYEPMREASAELAAFLDRLPDQRARWRRRLGVKKGEVDAAYALLRWADTFSLVLCQRKLPEDARALEIGTGPDGTRYDVRQRADGSLGVEPWPYERDAFTVELDRYRLDRLTFDGDDALAEALHAADAEPARWMLRRD